jgi:hypothetical protein
MAQSTYLARKGGDADFNNVTVAGTLTVTGATAYGDTALADAVAFGFGTGDETNQDVEIQWDGTNLIVSALTDDYLIEWGDASATQKSFDHRFTMNEANGASYFYLDASANLMYTTGVDLQLKDDDFLVFGSGAGATGDVQLEWDTAGTPDALLLTCSADDTVFSIGVAAATQKSFDVEWFANEAAGASYLYMDASANLIYTVGVDLQFKDNDVLVFGTGSGATGDVGITYDANSLNVTPTAAADALELGATGHLLNTTLTGSFTVGVDATGYDVKFYGDTTGCSFLYDQSEDQLVVTGPADVPALKLAGAGSISAAAYAAAGAAWADGATPAFVEDQKYMLIDVAGTVYRIPLFANA